MGAKSLICGVWILLLVQDIANQPEDGRPFNIEYIPNHPGLFYEDIGQVKLVEKEWQIIVTLDYLTIHYKLNNETQPQYVSVWNHCRTLFEIEDCQQHLRHNQFMALKRESEMLNQHLTEVFKAQDEEGEVSRGRRSPLLKFVGTISRSLFGTMDYNDYKHINKEIDKLYSGQNQITHLVNNATYLIRSELDNMAQHMEASRRNIQILRNATNHLEQEQNDHAFSIRRLEMALKFQHIGNEFVQATKIYLDSTRKITEAIDAAKHGRITQTFLTPEQLDQAAEKIRRHHPEFEFPIPKGKTDYPALSKISTIHVGHTKGKFLIVIAVPLLSRQRLQIYHVRPCIKSQQTTNGIMVAWIKPKKPYLIISEDRQRPVRNTVGVPIGFWYPKWEAIVPPLHSAPSAVYKCVSGLFQYAGIVIIRVSFYCHRSIGVFRCLLLFPVGSLLGSVDTSRDADWCFPTFERFQKEFIVDIRIVENTSSTEENMPKNLPHPRNCLVSTYLAYIVEVLTSIFTARNKNIFECQCCFFAVGHCNTPALSMLCLASTRRVSSHLSQMQMQLQGLAMTAIGCSWHIMHMSSYC
nr:PREDICTED: uncharacterized protein LOC105272703 [Fopius arisanus]